MIRGPLPAVLTVELDLAKPRRASLPQLIHSLRAAIMMWDAEAIHADREHLGLNGSPTWVKKIFSPPAREGGPTFDAQERPEEAVGDCLNALLSDKTFAAKFLNRWKD